MLPSEQAHGSGQIEDMSKDRGMCLCQCQRIEPHCTLTLVLGYSNTQPPSPLATILENGYQVGTS